MATWDVFLPEVMPHALTAPHPLVVRHLRNAARTFFRRTQAWVEWLQPEATTAGAGVVYGFALPAQTEVVRLRRATRNGRPLSVENFRERCSDPAQHPGEGPNGIVSADMIEFTLPASSSEGDAIQAQVSLMPSRTAERLPDHLANRFLDAIADGAKSTLLLVPGDFNDPAMAGVWAAQFDFAIGEAQGDAYMGQTTTVPRPKPRWC